MTRRGGERVRREREARERGPSKLDLVHLRAKDVTGATAVCFRCAHFEAGASSAAIAAGVGTCVLRPGDPQFRFAVCLEWQRLPGSVVVGLGF